MSMSTEEEKFHVSSWWAKTPQFALEALQAQLEGAAVIWPELKSYKIGTVAPPTAPSPQATVEPK